MSIISEPRAEENEIKSATSNETTQVTRKRKRKRADPYTRLRELPPLMTDDRRVRKCIFGYCVSGSWLLDFRKYNGGDSARDPLSFACYTIGTCNSPNGGYATTAPVDQIYTGIIPDEETGELVSVIRPFVKTTHMSATVLGLWSNMCLLRATSVLKDGHAEFLMDKMKMKAKPQWYWCRKAHGMPICPQPWTPGPGGKIVKRWPHEIVDNPVNPPRISMKRVWRVLNS
ncbi:hypothetical protein QCA50_019689 [Cerrena zonata]|uniref:Uncharacterized protein n=1 Tax=Cerrena zonata TaxID=2478898 RepID=A0AAW0FET8_9APHY